MPIVLGGGLSGLAAAHYLNKRFINPVTLYEASNRVGGWIRTEKHDDKGFIFEVGPRTIRPKGPAAATTLELIEDLGLQNYINPIFASHPAASKRMIYVKNQLYMLPSKFSEFFQTLPPFSKPLASGIFNDIKAPPEIQKLNDESIYDFTERRFGSEIAKYAISSMICGICAGDAKEISVRFLMNDLFEQEQKHGGVIKGYLYNMFKKKESKNYYGALAESSSLAKQAKRAAWSIYTLKGGLDILPQTMAENLKFNGVEVKTSAECKKVTFCNERVVVRVNGLDEDTDHLVSALPSYKLAKLVESQHPSLACQLKSIPYVDVAVVNLQFSSTNLLQQEAFGFLVPPIERIPILGIIFDSCCIDMQGNTILTVMMGGRWFEDYFGLEPTQKDILDVAKKHVRTILKIYEEPKMARVNVLKQCIPQYTVGHKARVTSIRQYINKYNLPISVCGAAYDGVGLNDVLLSAKTQVYSLVDD